MRTGQLPFDVSLSNTIQELGGGKQRKSWPSRGVDV
jgi:hypothetical protein